MSTSEQRVLLIDHSGTSLAIMSKLISKNIPNTKVDTATTSREAFELLEAYKYNLITTSRNLPDIDCHLLLSQIRNEMNIAITPLIVISGETMGIHDEQMTCSKVNGYFDKKLGQKKLVEYINSFLNTSPPTALLTGNILYVEDSATVALATKKLLNKHNYEFTLAKDAEQAMQNISESYTKDELKPYDLVLTDIQLEGHMTGSDLIREIRHGFGLGYEELPILVTTSNNDDADPEGPNRIFSSGANDIIEKPVKESMLIARLNNLLMLRRLFLQLHQPDHPMVVQKQARKAQ